MDFAIAQSNQHQQTVQTQHLWTEGWRISTIATELKRPIHANEDSIYTTPNSPVVQ